MRDPINSKKISLIIPAYNAEKTISTCLDSLLGGSVIPQEIIVVDDGSTDRTPEIVKNYDLKYYRMSEKSYSAAARNFGVSKATGEIIIFIDSDIIVHRDTIKMLADFLLLNPEIDAVFGSYDDQPTAPSMVSKFRNLLHHYIHQNSNIDASTFWTGCGAVWIEVFEDLGGFGPGPDGARDIGFGYRMREHGYRIRLKKDIQVTHMKRWTLRSMIRTDIVLRAIPWSLLILKNRSMMDDLNLKIEERMASLLSWTAILGLGLGIFNGWFLLLLLAAWIGLAVLKRNLFLFYFQKGGVPLLLTSFLLYQLYLLYSSITFAFVLLIYPFIKPKMGESG